jgi:small subunit ribosomal protein S9
MFSRATASILAYRRATRDLVQSLQQHSKTAENGSTRASLRFTTAAHNPTLPTSEPASEPPSISPDISASSDQGNNDEEYLDLPDPSDPLANPLATLGAEEMSADQYYWRQRAASSPPTVHKRKVDKLGRAYATGKRKRSVARIWIREGTGSIVINGRNFVDMFNRVDHRDQILRPLAVTGRLGSFSIEGTVAGGGNTGQAEAIRHGIAKAIQFYDPGMRPPLKKDGLLTRDSRIVAPKLYGQKKHRKSFQWVKR